ncbi:MAG: aminopeptidase [Gemmatimonadetes bacterium]|nr:aminopeptidase [Gemmatimonadota bacterium]
MSGERTADPDGGGSGRRRRPRARLLVVAAAAVVVAASLWPGTACSPGYVIKAGWEEAKILRARRPIPEVILEPETDEETRAKLALATEARDFAMNGLELDVGDSYTTYTKLERDTLAMVLSAAYQDQLLSRTWWFPIVGRVPYRGFFDLDDALNEQAKLEEEGFDTYLRPTSAFSTLGWFSDPILSTILRYDEVELVATIIHELSHNHLFVSGQVRFNESFATWVGRTGAIEFFCTRPGDTLEAGPDHVDWCQRARDRWHDVKIFSSFIDRLVAELEVIYDDSVTTREDKITRRGIIFDRFRKRFQEEIRPQLLNLTFASFESIPLNNATLLSRMRYYHRLPDFDALLERHAGSLSQAVRELEAGLETASDPFELLPSAVETGSPPGGSETPDNG